MPDTPAHAKGLPIDDRTLESAQRHQASSANLGSMQHKAVRIGSVEPAHITLVKQGILPAAVVVTLLLSMVAFDQALTAPFYALALVAFQISAQIFSPIDLRRAGGRGRTRKVPSGLLLEWACVVAVLVFLAVSFQLTHVFPRDAMLVWFLATPLALWLTDSLVVPVARRLATGRPLGQRFIIVGVNDVGLELARRIDQSDVFGRFFGFFDHRSAERASDVAGRHVTCNFKAGELADAVRAHSIDQVYIALPISTTPRIEELLQELRDTTASVFFVPNVFAFDLMQARCVEINGMPALSICDSPLQGMSAFWKRALDLAAASLALLLLWPGLLFIAIAIKRSSPGPVLFKQRRYGLNGEEILVYKFRTMTVCEDGPVIAQATKQDRRITKLGAFLRRKSLDELPQILNVLEGKMSFVGPRPHAVAHNEEYRKLINGYMIRHKVRPGITGWAQIHGLRGETSTVEKMRQRVQYDLDYLRNWSLRLDLAIMARTAWTVLTDRNAY